MVLVLIWGYILFGGCEFGGWIDCYIVGFVKILVGCYVVGCFWKCCLCVCLLGVL